jgi:uncharacterized protein (DUF2384 family)
MTQREHIDADALCRARCDSLREAEAVFGNWEQAARWLTSELQALGGKRPLDLLDTVSGTERVRYVLNCIEHGIYS